MVPLASFAFLQLCARQSVKMTGEGSSCKLWVEWYICEFCLVLCYARSLSILPGPTPPLLNRSSLLTQWMWTYITEIKVRELPVAWEKVVREENGGEQVLERSGG